MNYYAGVDLSLTGSGVVVINPDGKIIKQKLVTSSPKTIIEERIVNITYDVLSSIYPYSTIYIEGLAFGARGSSMLELAALHYFVRIKLHSTKEKYKVIVPGTLKKFVTGKGSSKKELMLLQIYKKWGESFDDHNLADAYGLARLCLHEAQPKNKTQLKLRK